MPILPMFSQPLLLGKLLVAVLAYVELPVMDDFDMAFQVMLVPELHYAF